MADKITIGQKEYTTTEAELLHTDLSFYPENPRVYSALNVSEEEPSQELIEETLCKMEHVKQLEISIKANGGLIDPIIVKAGGNIVLEGNSRLAAYKRLAKTDPIRWGKIKCKILPENISDSAIFTLLGQYHIISRKDWSPYEQAGYLYRRLKSADKDIEYIAKELGIHSRIARSYINVYSFMVQHSDLQPDRWSYYEEYLKNANLKKYRSTHSDMDDKIVEQIKNGNIVSARDIRDKMGAIAKLDSTTAKKIMRNIIDGKIDIYEGYERIEDSGKIGFAYQILKKFREKICDSSFNKDIAGSEVDPIKYELKKIQKKIDNLINSIEKSKL